jgi:predicted SAM-dependent methyltransferase
MKALILGAGTKRYESFADCTTVDINPRTNPTVVHNLNRMPYPFEDDVFDIIVLEHVLEHLDDVVAVMEELHRIARPQAKLIITVPYFRSIWAHIDPTHKQCFSWDTLSYFDVNHPYQQKYRMTDCEFVIEDRQYNLDIDQTLFQKVLIEFAHRYPHAYERHISQIFPLEVLTYKMKVLK